MSSPIVRRISIARDRHWAYSEVAPSTLYIGHYEYLDLKSTPEYATTRIAGGPETFLGLVIVRVLEDYYLAVA